MATSSDDLSLQSVVPRTTPLVCPPSPGPPICLWPEAAGRAGELAAVRNHANRQLTEWDLPELGRLTQGRGRGGAVVVSADRTLGPDDLRYSLAAGYVDARTACTGLTGRWGDERRAVVAMAAGLTHASLQARFEPDVVTAAEERVAGAATSPGSVRAWFDDGLAEHRCEPER